MSNLPTVADGRDLALAGEATDAAIVPALEALVANLSHRAEAFDDVSVSLHLDRAADGSSRSCFSYRAVKQRRA
jgi:hypothetical protein